VQATANHITVRFAGRHLGMRKIHRRWWRVFSAFCLIVVTALSILFDYGRYLHEFREGGLLGFLRLPSVLALQFAFLLSAFFFFTLALRQSETRGLWSMVLLLCVATGVYCLSLWLIHVFSRAGEFGFGAVALVFLFGYFPSAVFIVVGFLATVLRVLRKPST
jgi:hypothetical protein